jgi:hypothetical protein
MTTINRTEPFPVDWNAWRELWKAWVDEQTTPVRGAQGHPAVFQPTSWRFPGKNFLADEVLGTWSVNGRNVELSEVTFPALGERPRRDERLVGVTFGTGAGSDEGAVCRTFAELEEMLGLNE